MMAVQVSRWIAVSWPSAALIRSAQHWAFWAIVSWMDPLDQTFLFAMLRYGQSPLNLGLKGLA